MSRDGTDLIYSIAEWTAIFGRSRSLDDFLDTVVDMVAKHMDVDVCSIYLMDDKQERLILRATHGLAKKAVYNVSLRVGEGLTGVALKELRPICEACASQHPDYSYFPGIDEEKYEAFLAVPIACGLERVGVLVLQHSEKGYFKSSDIKTLRAIAAQLAHTIANSRLLMNLRKRYSIPFEEKEPPQELHMVRGRPVSGGIAIGRATIADVPHVEALLNEMEDHTRDTAEGFERALELTETQLTELQEQMEESYSDIAALIFSAHLMILRDESFAGAIRRRIDEGILPTQAVVNTVNDYIRVFSESSSPQIQEKTHDIKDLGHRLLNNLAGRKGDTGDYQGHIVIASEILPSDVMRYAAQKAEGLVLLSAGVMSHVSILARSIGIPMMVADESRVLTLDEGAPLLMDADQGTLYVQPSEMVRERYDRLLRTRTETEKICRISKDTFTADGHEVWLYANINLLSDVDAAQRLQAHGIGLYRSEFPFIVRNEFPTENEQFHIYRKLVQSMKGREVTFRTLDVGGDKMLSYYSHVKESNPFLGLRAIRFSLRNRHVFMDQLRAMLRAGVDAPIRIMFPLISSVDDFIQARDVVRECCDYLRAEDVPFNADTKLGAMVELPSVVEVIDELAAEADFMSIGTNDLIQYMLAVDRTSEHMAEFYLAYHPAVLRAMKKVVDAGNRNGCEVSICGDFASSPMFLEFILGLGIRKISVDPHTIPQLQEAIEEMSIAKATEKAGRMLGMGRVSEVAAFLGLTADETVAG